MDWKHSYMKNLIKELLKRLDFANGGRKFIEDRVSLKSGQMQSEEGEYSKMGRKFS